MIKDMKIILLFVIVLSIPVNSTLINIKKNIKIAEVQKNKETERILQNKIVKDVMEIIAVIIIIFLFFNSPVWAIALFTLPVLYNGIQYMYKFEEQKNERKLLEKVKNSSNFMKKKLLDKELEDYLKKLKSNVYKYLSISNFKIKKQLDERQLIEIVKDYFKNKDILNQDTNNNKNEEKTRRLLKEKKIDNRKNEIEISNENSVFDLNKNIKKYSKIIFKGRIQFRQLIDEL